jgi:hypothetical protein
MSHQRLPVPPAQVHEGMRIQFPDPRVVSSPATPARPHPNQGEMGPKYGTQQFANWAPGEVDPRQVLDTMKAGALWRISVFGHVLVTVMYGTSHNRAIENLQAPVVITVPGQAIVTATPRDSEGTTCVVTLTQATAGALSQARKFVARGGADVDLDEGACRYFALTASTLTISGAATVVPALSVVPLVAGSVLTSGSGFQEFEA